MSEDYYWWSRYGNFSPGVGIYPHMGQVITEYRVRRGLTTQKSLAIALGYSERTIQELEGSMNLDSPDTVSRRMRKIIANTTLSTGIRLAVYGLQGSHH